MTIVMYAANSNSIVLAADGFSTERFKAEPGRLDMLSDKLQKIFPLRERPIAVAHRGMNRLGEMEISELMASFSTELSRELTPERAALAVQRLFEPFVDVAWPDLEEYKDHVGFWIAGFTPAGQQELYETKWWWDGQLCNSFEKLDPLHDRFAGQTEEVIAVSDELYKTPIRDLPTNGMRDRLRKVYRKAVERHTRGLIGGKYRELTITSEGCRWTGPHSDLRDCMVAQ